MQKRAFDLLVLGGGTAGLGVAHRAAARGWRVALAEAHTLGGTCVNWGCMPTKTLIESSRVAAAVGQAHWYGIGAQAGPVDWARIKARKDQVVANMRDGIYQGVEEVQNLELFQENAVLVDENTVEVGDERLQAPRLVLAAGARNQVPPVPGLQETPFFDSTSIMEVEELPGDLIMIGGGIIALEFSQLLARLGTRVTILQRDARLAPNLEPEISQALVPILEREGIRVILEAETRETRAGSRGVELEVSTPGQAEVLAAEALMVSAGRRPNTDRLAVERAGVETDGRGYARVDDAFATSVPGIYAAGDITGGAMFTHRAWHDGLLLSRRLLEDAPVDAAGRLIPYAVFTDPEAAAVGLGEAEAREQGYRVEARHLPLEAVGRARALGQETGLLKLISRADDGLLLGAHFLAPHAGEYVHELAMALRQGARLQDLQEMMHIHPTLAEGINSAALS